MKITCLGATADEVTGSTYLVQADAANVMADCGLFQGTKKLDNSNHLPTTSALQQLHAVVLTHAHLDHTGRLNDASVRRPQRTCRAAGSPQLVPFARFVAAPRDSHARRGGTTKGSGCGIQERFGVQFERPGYRDAIEC